MATKLGPGPINVYSEDKFSSNLFLLFSVVTVNRPLDYEQVPGGMIYLTLMAMDGGAPALNSTVPITVELFVSILHSC